MKASFAVPFIQDFLIDEIGFLHIGFEKLAALGRQTGLLKCHRAILQRNGGEPRFLYLIAVPTALATAYLKGFPAGLREE